MHDHVIIGVIHLVVMHVVIIVNLLVFMAQNKKK